ncbi:MAG: NlpC/P60 family protein, partial [Bacteroidota bacterium]
MVKNVVKLIMLLGTFAFLVANCGSYKPEKYDPNKRYTAKSYSSKDARLRADIAAHAQRYVGVPYKYAGTTPKGFDCSGFTSFVLKNYIAIPRSSVAQAEEGKPIALPEVKP